MDSEEKEMTKIGLLDRIRKTWFPPAAAVGAFAAFVAAGSRARTAPKAGAGQPNPASAPKTDQSVKAIAPNRKFDREYAQVAVLGGAASAHPFRHSLAGVAIGAADRIYALGDDEVRLFDPNGNLIRVWQAAKNAACLTVGPDELVYVAAAGRVEIYNAEGSRVGGFAAGDQDRPARITAIKIFRKEILVADAAARLIRRYDSSGKQLGLIGAKNKAGNFILPNKSLDMDVDSEGVVHTTDTGRHKVSAWALDG